MRKLIAAILAAIVLPSAAQDAYPSRPVRLVVGYAPGGGTDVMARLLAARLTEQMNQNVFVENKPGASGIIGATHVARAAPDGYTLMMGVVSLNAIQPSLMASLPFDPIKDFTPIALVVSVPHFIVVPPTMEVKTLNELIAYAKVNPGKISYPSAGTGTTPHIAGELFRSMTGTDMVHVPYKSTGQSMPDLLAGRLQVGFDTLPTTATHVRNGKLRALAVTSGKRLADFPDVPTVEEAGVPGYRFSTWYGVFGPGGLPHQVVAKLNSEILRALEHPETKAKLAEMGAEESAVRSPEQFAALVRSDIARFAKVVKDANIKIQ